MRIRNDSKDFFRGVCRNNGLSYGALRYRIDRIVLFKLVRRPFSHERT